MIETLFCGAGLLISPDDFRKRWCKDDEDSLVVYSTESLVEVSIPDESRVFLTLAGLPESAAPFLDFSAPENGTLPTAAAVWHLPSDYDCYRIIGSDGSGDPLCIDESRDGQVVSLNHDNFFQRVLINSSIPQLAESLLAYRHLVIETQKRNGEDAFLDGDIPGELKQWLRKELIRIDSSAVQENCFWSYELANF